MTLLVHKELSYQINGLCFQLHRELGRHCSERQYADRFEELLIEKGVEYQREVRADILQKGNQMDFTIQGEIVVEFKAKNSLSKNDYHQILRYLRATNYELGIIYNFRTKYLHPKRILNGKHYFNKPKLD